MKKAFYLLFSIAIVCGLFSCSDDNVGSSLVDTQLNIVADSSFTIQGVSVANSEILTRTSTQLLGAIKAPNYGELHSDFVCQLMPPAEMDTTYVVEENIDSIRMFLAMKIGNFTGDSVTPMRLNVYRLNKQLPTPITSNFSPEGYYSNSDLLGSASYTATSKSSYSFSSYPLSSMLAPNAYRVISIKLPVSMAREMFREFKNNPSTFETPSNFAKFFPGMYVTTSYGNGRVINIEKNFMMINFRRKYKNTNGNDTTVVDSIGVASASPEVIMNNNIRFAPAQSVKDMVASGKCVLQAPLGYDVKVNFPIQNIIDKFVADNRLKVLNTLTMEIPVDSVATGGYGIKPPKYLLLIKTSEKDAFFKEGKLADNVSSFVATYNSTSKSYTFSGLRSYMLDIINNKNKIATDEDSNLSLIPVDVTTETVQSDYYSTSEIVTSICPAVSGPSIGVLNLDKAKIKMVYSNQSVGY